MMKPASQPFLYFAGGTVILVVLFQKGGAISCWECNSHYESNCADPFDNHSISLIDCNKKYLSHYPNTAATICRKIIQKVNDEYRYIRGCGWMTDDRDGLECIKRAGTFHVFVQYCSCKTDLCNLAESQRSNWLSLSLTVIPVTLLTLS